jgi:hypothetical protein
MRKKKLKNLKKMNRHTANGTQGTVGRGDGIAA